MGIRESKRKHAHDLCHPCCGASSLFRSLEQGRKSKSHTRGRIYLGTKSGEETSEIMWAAIPRIWKPGSFFFYCNYSTVKKFIFVEMYTPHKTRVISYMELCVSIEINYISSKTNDTYIFLNFFILYTFFRLKRLILHTRIPKLNTLRELTLSHVGISQMILLITTISVGTKYLIGS